MIYGIMTEILVAIYTHQRMFPTGVLRGCRPQELLQCWLFVPAPQRVRMEVALPMMCGIVLTICP